MAGMLPSVLVHLLFLLLYAACGVAMIVKLRGAAAILGGIGWALLCLVTLARFIVFRTDLDPLLVRDIVAASGMINIIGLICILIGLFCIRLAPREQASAPRESAARAVLRPSRYRPGWGLVAAWISVSAVGWLAGLAALAVVIEAGSHINDDEAIAMAIAFGISFLFVIATAILYLTWLYQSWNSVPDEFRSASPGQAVGFLFIPFFNLYWVFRAVPGLSASIRRTQEALDPHRPSGASYGWGIAAAILALIPYISILSYFLFLVWVVLVNGERNRMLETLERALPEED